MNHKTNNTHAIWYFFLLAFGISWLFWIPAALIDADIQNSPWIILLYLGGLGPVIAGVALTYLMKDREYQREYWQRALNPRRIGGWWFLIILAAYPLLVVLVSLISRGHVQASDTLLELLPQPVQIIPFVLFMFIFGPFPEEFGWRGFALNELQARMSALNASLLIGVCWAVWHIPLFFMNGTYQNEMGFGSLAFWQFSFFAVIFSVLITWVFNNNRSSTLSATLFHFTINLTGNIIAITQTEELVRNGLLLVIAAIVVLVYGKETLSLKSEQL